jgi:omega-6 fatty acid desaturase (delta-12 desaturase)
MATGKNAAEREPETPRVQDRCVCTNERDRAEASLKDRDGLDPGLRALRAATAAYQVPRRGRSLWQLATTVGPFLGLWAAMYALLPVSYALSLLLAVPAAAFVVRLFIIQHDCGHGSFFRSRAVNDWIGRVCSLVTFTPYANWRRQHNGHHAHWNNLDHRQSGADIYSSCLTVAEYRALRPGRRFLHRLLCHPLVAFVVVPPLAFMVLYRFPFDTPRAWTAERWSVHLTNLSLLAMLATLGVVLGFRQVLLVQAPISVAASIVGVWLFSIQHKFEGVQWFRGQQWDAAAAALHGSSYLRLPGWLQWLTGSIGLHHVHHFNPRIPNYHLEECRRRYPQFRAARTLSMVGAMRTSGKWLWDETNGRMVSFRAVRR